MAKPATDRLKLNPPLGLMPSLQYLPPDMLLIDAAYQRSLDGSPSQALIRRIAQHWNWDLCQPLVVARRDNGGLFVIDGQHRLAAARLRGDIGQLPAVVVQYVKVEDEAASFVHLNQQRRPLGKLDLFKAAVASGDSEASAIVGALDAAGLSLAGHTNYTAWKPGQIANISGIEQSWKKHGAEVTAAALGVMATAFAGQVLRYAGTIFPGIAQVVADEFEQSDTFAEDLREAFMALLVTVGQEGWRKRITEAKVEFPQLKFAAASALAMRRAWEGGRGYPVAAAVPAPVKAVPKIVMPACMWPHWCSQCEAKVSEERALTCGSAFCKAKALVA